MDILSESLPQRRLALVALFVVSGVGLIFEITLTRLFSLYFQYHFTFLAVSLAVLGLSLGAASAYFLSANQIRSTRTLTLLLTALSVSLSLAAFLIAGLASVESIFPRALVAVIPFFFIGLFDAVIFENYHLDSGAFYAADLVGAAIGVLSVLALLFVWSPFSVVLFLAVLVALIAVLIGSPQRAYAIGGLVLAVGLFAANMMTGLVDYDPTSMIGAPRDKTMVAILQDQSQAGKILRTHWSAFARVDVVGTNDESVRYIFADGGAGSFMLAYDGDLASLDPYVQTLEYLPFQSGSIAKTLIVGAGGGKDVLLAAHAGATSIEAVEINSAIVDAVQEDAAYNGAVFDLPQVHLVEADARSFVEQGTTLYDLIYMNLAYTQAVEPASQTLIENYLFTSDAFQTFYDHLTPGGRLVIITHNALEASRASVTALQAMENMGIKPSDGLDHLWLWMYPAGDQTLQTSVLIMGKDPLPTATLRTLNQTALSLGMKPLFAPGDYEVLFETLRNGFPLSLFIAHDGDYNLSPTTDDQPYFFNLDYGLPSAIRSSLVMAVLLALCLLGLATFAYVEAKPSEKQRWWILIAYALVIGLGFMLIEIPLIQRFQMLLGQPIWSLAAVLTSLLLSGGVGSLISHQWSETQLMSRLRFVGLWIGGVAVLYWFLLPTLVTMLLPLAFGVRLLGIVVLTALLGIPMGIPFPSLLRFANKGQQVALLWAINGVFSVLGSTLAVIIAMQWGFRWVLLSGACLYLILALLVGVFLRPALVKGPR